MKRIGNEQGSAALFYVVMVAVVLMAVIPLLLTMTSTDSIRNQRDGQSMIAENLAASGMEAFLAYVASYNEAADGDPVDYIGFYPAYGEHTFTTPEGVNVLYRLQFNGPDEEGIYTAEVEVEASLGEIVREKNVRYAITPPTSGTGPIPNEEGRYVVPEGYDGIYVQLVDTNVPSDINVDRSVNNLNTIIGTIIDDKEVEVADDIADYEASAITCICNGGVTDINAAVNENSAAASPTNPIVIKVNNNVQLNDNKQTINWGTAEKPVVLIVNDISFNKENYINVVGELIVQNVNYSNATGSKINVYGVEASYGNLYIKGAVNVTNSNGISFYADSDIYANSVQMNSNTATFEAESLTVSNHFNTKNNLNLKITSDIAVGTMNLGNNANLDVSAGDFLIQGNFTAGNNADLSTGGIIASGGNFTLGGGQNTVKTGGGSTSLIEIAEIISGGEGTPGTGWVIRRK